MLFLKIFALLLVAAAAMIFITFISPFFVVALLNATQTQPLIAVLVYIVLHVAALAILVYLLIVLIRAIGRHFNAH